MRKSASTPTTSSSTSHRRHSGSQIVVQSSNMIPAVLPNVPGAIARNSPFLAPLIPLYTKDGMGVVQQSPVAIVGDAGGGQRRVSGDGSPVVVGTPITAQSEFFSPRLRLLSLQGPSGVEEATAGNGNATVTPTTATTATTGNAAANVVGTAKAESQNSLSASGLMGKLRNFGRATKRPTSDGGSGIAGTSPVLSGGVGRVSVENATAEVRVIDGFLLSLRN
jgi:WD repeat-containing protein 48